MSLDIKVVALVAGLASLLFVGAASTTTSSAEARALVKQGALLLDVRTLGEYSEGHLEGAVNVPVQTLEAGVPLDSSKKDQDVVVYCRSGHRSAKAASLLKSAGFTKVHDLGAMSNW
jgi:phage shock protein E